eukprot:gene2293-3145_t
MLSASSGELDRASAPPTTNCSTKGNSLDASNRKRCLFDTEGPSISSQAATSGLWNRDVSALGPRLEFAATQISAGITLGTVVFTDGAAKGGCRGEIQPSPDPGLFIADVPCALEVFISRRPGKSKFTAPAPAVLGQFAIGGAAATRVQNLPYFMYDFWTFGHVPNMQSLNHDVADVAVYKWAHDPHTWQRPAGASFFPVSVVVGVDFWPVPPTRAFDPTARPIPLDDLGSAGPTIPIDGLWDQADPDLKVITSTAGVHASCGVPPDHHAPADHLTYFARATSILPIRWPTAAPELPITPLDPECLAGQTSEVFSGTCTPDSDYVDYPSPFLSVQQVDDFYCSPQLSSPSILEPHTGVKMVSPLVSPVIPVVLPAPGLSPVTIASPFIFSPASTYGEFADLNDQALDGPEKNPVQERFGQSVASSLILLDAEESVLTVPDSFFDDQVFHMDLD